MKKHKKLVQKNGLLLVISGDNMVKKISKVSEENPSARARSPRRTKRENAIKSARPRLSALAAQNGLQGCSGGKFESFIHQELSGIIRKKKEIGGCCAAALPGGGGGRGGRKTTQGIIP